MGRKKEAIGTVAGAVRSCLVIRNTLQKRADFSRISPILKVR